MASLLAKISLISLIVAVILGVVGFATPGWARFAARGTQGKIDRFGLFQTCQEWRGRNLGCRSGTAYDDQSWFSNVRGLCAAGFVFVLLSIAPLLLYILMNLEGLISKLVKFCFITLPLLGGLLLLVAPILFAAKMTYNYEFQYSFGMTIVGGIIGLVAGVLNIIEVCRNKSS